MASRNIANMHLFLEMKTKFPYLPEDTLRNYVFLYAQDQAKCLSLLQKENENHFHLSHQFSDFRQTENKDNCKLENNIKVNSDSKPNPVVFNIPPEINTNMAPNNMNNKPSDSHEPTVSSGRTNRSTNFIKLSTKSTNFSHLPNQESLSAPVLDESERPFVSMFTSVPDSSHNVFKQIPRDQSYHNRMMFSTTKEHAIESPVTNDNNYSQNYSSSSKPDLSKRHAVKLSITPALPFQQQQMNVFSNAVSATASHTSRPGRHTTSVNFQLQPEYSNQFPLEISTVPVGVGNTSNYRDFGSHVQISVGAQGTTFTALRLQRPSTVKNPSYDYTPKNISLSKEHRDCSRISSQNTNSKFNVSSNLYKLPGLSVKNPIIKVNDHHACPEQNENGSVSHFDDCGCHTDSVLMMDPNEKRGSNHRSSLNHSYQSTPDYIHAVKSHQRAQLKIVQEELDKAKSNFSNLKSQINKMELELLKRKENNHTSSNAQIIKNLRDENRQLRLECNCLLLEYDMISKGQIPVGVTDEDFYSNIFTGPNDGLGLCSQKGQKMCNKETTKIEQVSDDEDYEKNTWKCKKCTFVNHPALEKCEICEISRNSGSLFDDN